MRMLSARKRVQNGAMLLDSAVPGWYNKIDIDKLVIGSCYNCILGQIYGYFYRGIKKIGLKNGEGISLGFGLTPKNSSIDNEEKLLVKRWKEQIEMRKEQEKEKEKETIEKSNELVLV